jgi:hypothetical protein
MPTLLAPPIHVRPAPSLDPPYDDELGPASVVPAPGLVAQPPLPLDWSGRHRPTPAAAGATETTAPPRTMRRPPSPARGATMHFLSLCLEVLNGYRPVAHLRRLTTPAEFNNVAEQMARARARMNAPERQVGSCSAPPRSVVRPLRGGPPARIRLRKLLLCEPRPGLAEAAAVLGHDDRSFALALRLERRPTGWLCTLAQVI